MEYKFVKKKQSMLNADSPEGVLNTSVKTLRPSILFQKYSKRMPILYILALYYITRKHFFTRALQHVRELRSAVVTRRMTTKHTNKKALTC